MVLKFQFERSPPCSLARSVVCAWQQPYPRNMVAQAERFNGFRKKCTKSVNVDWVVIALFRSQIMREISAASTAFSAKVYLYARRGLIDIWVHIE